MRGMNGSSWTRAYRLALHSLPVALRRKHGAAMEALFARELERAHARGRLHGALAGAAGVWDVVRRGAYEQVRLTRAADPGDSHVPQPMQLTPRQLLRRLAVSFTVTFLALTAVLLANFAARRAPPLSGRAMTASTVIEVVLLSVPFVAALTIPMAVLVAVLREFMRLRADGTLAAQRERAGVRGLVIPVVGAAAVVAALTLVNTAMIVPRTNERLMAVLTEGVATPNDRTMTIDELREAARAVRPSKEPVALARAAAYEVEVQKKLALPAACVVMALAGIALALRVRRGGVLLAIGASGAVFAGYYVMLVTGERLADRLVVSPFVAMWGPNALLLAAALLAIGTRRAALTRSSLVAHS